MRKGRARRTVATGSGAGAWLINHLLAFHSADPGYVPKTLITTTGDLLVGGTGETMLFQGMEYADATRLGIGSDGMGLVADSTVSGGIAWKYGIPITVLRTADTSPRTNNTLTNDDATGGTLQFPIGTSTTETYFVEAYLQFNAANATMDIKVGWNATSLPAGATASWGMVAGLNTLGPAPLAGFMGVTVGSAASALVAIGGTMNAASGAAITSGLALAGTFVGGGTAGNIIFAWSQVTTDAGNLILKAGSFLRVTRLRA